VIEITDLTHGTKLNQFPVHLELHLFKDVGELEMKKGIEQKS